jgi:transcription initiation factor IIE alpha subunit
MGLNEKEINVLKLLLKKQLSTTEISFKTGYSGSSVRSIIKGLTENKLLKTKKAGRNVLYSAFTSLEIPKVKDIRQKQAELSNEKITAEVMNKKIDIKNVKTMLKGIEEDAEISDRKIVYYPYYEAVVIKEKSKSKIELDAVTKRFS